MPAVRTSGGNALTQSAKRPARKKQRSLRSSREQLRLMVQAVKDYAIFMLDPEGNVVTWNDGAERIKGYTAGEIIGKHYSHFYTEEDKAAGKPARHLQIAEREGRHEIEGWRIRKDGSSFFADVVITAIRDEKGKLIGYCKVTRDVTERRKAEAELAARDAALEAARLKSLFLATMSHELRTPLHIVLTYADVIERHLTKLSDTSQARAFDTVRRAGNRLRETIDRILDISRIETGAFEIRRLPLDVASLIGRLIDDYRPLAYEKGLVLKSDVTAAQGVLLLFDEYCLIHALGNLIENAIKFTSRGDISLRLFRENDRGLFLEVIDSGIGIDPSFLPYLFEPFSQEDSGYSRRFQGAGLGLALVKRYLRLNNANIVVESEKGRGTRFLISFSPDSVLLPAADTENVAITKSPAISSNGKPVILLIEDDVDSREAMSDLLSDRYTVRLASTAKEARTELFKSGQHFDLILMDLSLGGEEDGLALTSAIRRHPSGTHVPIVALTAHAFPEDKVKALRAGCNDYLAKPFSVESLTETIEKTLNTHLL